MKKLLTSPISNLILFGIFLAFMVPAIAQSGKATQAAAKLPSGSRTQAEGTGIADSSKADEPIAVKYLGTAGELLSFQVAYQNPGGQKFSIFVKDQDGGLLYQGVFADKIFYKQFHLPGADKSKISFIFRNYRGADISRSFAINVNSRFVEEVAIKKTN